jgi:hypothetical protein
MHKLIFFSNLRIVILIFFISIICCNCKAQENLVNNPSFEDTISLDINSNAFINEFIHHWNGWVDIYFNEFILESYGLSVPSNYMGIQIPKTGIAYASVKTISIVPSQNRAYIQTKLKEQLQLGKKYCFKMYASLGDSCKWANNSIQVFLSNDSIDATYANIINASPQLNFPNHASLNNKIDWVELVDTLISDGTERWITIGNFLPDSLTEVMLLNDTCYGLPTGTTVCQSHYYIDDVSLVLVNETSTNDDRDKEPNFLIFPNPNKGIFQLICPTNSSFNYELVSPTGQLITLGTIQNAKNYVDFDCSNISKGIYYLKIVSASKTISLKISIN